MKLASYLLDGRPSYGVIEGNGVVDLGRRIGAKYPDLRALITANALDEAKRAAAGAKADASFDPLTHLPVIPNPDKIVCVGLNYEEHRVETNRDKTENPALFLRVPGSQLGHRQPMPRPRESKMFDYEGEIAVIIGTGGRRIPESDAWRHIVGYACYNDGSVRDWQRHTVQWTAGKNFARTGPFGPWMVTADEIPPNTILTLVTRLNGTEMQRATTEMMIFKIPRLINYISTFTELVPGDVIVTGTPGGVGSRRTPPVWMNPGDKVEIDIDKVGVLVNTISED
jgi:2-keto-4-pentenoate hydratase/2-oxohepta-3-ene-1,7-dioic acid hydratase in catechol pathway